MKRISLYLFFGLIICPFAVHCQDHFFDFDFSQMATPDIKSTIVGDSLFISYRKKTIGADPTYMWISRDGNARNVSLAELDKQELLGILPSSTITRYFFTAFEKNVQTLKCLAFNERTGEKILADSVLSFEGSLIGSYLDTTLCLLVADVEFIRIFRINGRQQVSERKFRLPQELLKNKRTPVSFVPNGHPPSIEDGSAPVKLLLSDSALYIIQDQPKSFQTTLHSIALASGEVKTNLFLEGSKEDFYSFLCDGKLYRIVGGKNVVLQVFDIRSGKQEHVQVITESKKRIEFYEYTRNGVDRTVTSRWFSGWIPKVSFLMAQKVGGEVVVTVGSTYEIREGFIPFGFVVGSMAEVLIGLASNIAVRAIENPKLIHGYWHLKAAPSSGFGFTDGSGLLMQKIDDYEKQFDPKKTKFLFKGYLDGKKYTYAFYQKLKLNKIEIVRFENPGYNQEGELLR